MYKLYNTDFIGGLFGNTSNNSGGLFGNTQKTGGGLFGNTSGGGLFGNTSSNNTGGLFANNQSNQQQQQSVPGIVMYYTCTVCVALLILYSVFPIIAFFLFKFSVTKKRDN